MSKHKPGKIPTRRKLGVCDDCGYRITKDELDDVEIIDTDEKFSYVHGRCELPE